MYIFLGLCVLIVTSRLIDMLVSFIFVYQVKPQQKFSAVEVQDFNLYYHLGISYNTPAYRWKKVAEAY